MSQNQTWVSNDKLHLETKEMPMNLGVALGVAYNKEQLQKNVSNGKIMFQLPLILPYNRLFLCHLSCSLAHSGTFICQNLTDLTNWWQWRSSCPVHLALMTWGQQKTLLAIRNCNINEAISHVTNQMYRINRFKMYWMDV